MSPRPSRSRRWATATRWPIGVVLASWRYMWSTTPIHRWEMTGSWPQDAPPELPAGAGEHEALQRMEAGVGPMLHRIYRTRIVGTTTDAEELMAKLCADLDRVAPTEFATFQKIGGEPGLGVGDEFVVRMPGPWDGPVVVVEKDRASFRLATLDGHLEAGQIEFRATRHLRSLSFEIESWARSGDRLSDLLYTHLRISKEVQLHMWSSVLRKVVDLTEGKMEGGIVITTRGVAPAELPSDSETSPPDAKGDRALAALAQRQVNFNPDSVHEYVSDQGWRVDDMVEPLPHEGSGPPAEDGSWQVAKQVMDSYQLADPSMVDAAYDRGGPLEGRDMLLRIHFGPLRFSVGVRIGEVYENTIEVEGREVLVFGWSYRTLEGHFEQGQMHYELWKWLDSGGVEFHLRAVSRAARRGPWLLRTGFRLLGRGPRPRPSAAVLSTGLQTGQAVDRGGAGDPTRPRRPGGGLAPGRQVEHGPSAPLCPCAPRPRRGHARRRRGRPSVPSRLPPSRRPPRLLRRSWRSP